MGNKSVPPRRVDAGALERAVLLCGGAGTEQSAAPLAPQHRGSHSRARRARERGRGAELQPGGPAGRGLRGWGAWLGALVRRSIPGEAMKGLRPPALPSSSSF